VASAFGRQVNFGQVIKMYRPNPEAGRYAPSALLSVTRHPMWGQIEPRSISTWLKGTTLRFAIFFDVYAALAGLQ
jgi:hypothetical protein